VYVTESSTVTVKPQSQVAVVSPQQLYLDALQRLLRSPAYTIMGAGRTLDEALQDKGPDSLLSLVVYNLDTDEEVEQELDNIRAVRKRFPFARSVILADCRSASTKLKVMQAGIEAILSRDISIDVLRSSVELVLLGKCIMPAELARPLLRQDRLTIRQEHLAMGVELPPGPLPCDTLPKPVARSTALLSSREHQILQCLITGLTNKAIARDLDISEATVKVHVKALLRKTRLANRTQAAIWALNNTAESMLLAAAANEDESARSWLSDERDLANPAALGIHPGTNANRVNTHDNVFAHPQQDNRNGSRPQGIVTPLRGTGCLMADDVP
jgi:two-component system nitrate/nitrite response regulator NarL